jgi:hypothetical protein
MKKFIYGTLFLALVGIGIYGCKKESNNIQNNQIPLGIFVTHNLVKFSSIDSYKKFVDNQNPQSEDALRMIKNSGFKDYFSKNNNLSDKITEKSDTNNVYEMDDFLGQILNEDGIIQIGEHLYKIELFTETVKVLLYNDDKDNYQQAVKKFNDNDDSVQLFSVGDDVLEIMSGNGGEKCGGIGGGTYNAYSNPASNALIIAYIGNYAIRLNPYVKMFRAGIYYKLSAHYMLHSAVSNLGGIFNINVEVKGWQGGWYKKRPCGANDIGTLTANSIIINSSGASGSYTFYSGSRNLNGYYFFVRAKCTNCEGFTQWTLYGGRNINSPY